jgi:hypothetical protein
MSHFVLRKQKEVEKTGRPRLRVGRPPGVNRPASSAEITPESANEQIARRAYELYAAGGYREGHALDDWLAAERELLGQEDPL